MPKFLHSNDWKDRPLLTESERWRAVARVLKLSKPARLRLEWMIYYGKTRNAALTMRHFGLSGKVFYTWKNRFDETDLTSLEDRSKRPKTLRTREYTALEASRLQQLHGDHPTLGREKLRIIYAELYNQEISSWHARCIVHDYQLYSQRVVKSLGVAFATKVSPSVD